MGSKPSQPVQTEERIDPTEQALISKNTPRQDHVLRVRVVMRKRKTNLLAAGILCLYTLFLFLAYAALNLF